MTTTRRPKEGLSTSLNIGNTPNFLKKGVSFGPNKNGDSSPARSQNNIDFGFFSDNKEEAPAPQRTSYNYQRGSSSLRGGRSGQSSSYGNNGNTNRVKNESGQENDIFLGSKADLPEDDDDIGQRDFPIDESSIIYMKELRSNSVPKIIEIAGSYGIENINKMLKQDIICAILKKAASKNEAIYTEGIVQCISEGFGFLRYPDNNYINSSDNVYISQNQIKRFNLRTGDKVEGFIREPKRSEKYFSMVKLTKINDIEVGSSGPLKINFENLVPIFPKEKLKLDVKTGSNDDISTRIIDLIAPIGKGQRALIVAPPKSGKTVLLKNIAHAINVNHPEIYLIALLIDERPEEVTDITSSVKGEIVSSTFDEPADRHVALAEMVIARAKRLVEDGRDVLILLDSITRLARAYNTTAPSSGKILTGGIDANALQRPKRFFGAARNTKESGSLTIIATALVDTGSKMDDVIFEEFKGTGNSEIVLDRRLSDRRLFPAIDVLRSGTRKEEDMVDAETLSKMWALRRIITKMNDQIATNSDALEFLIKEIKKSSTNEEFFIRMNN